jgi:D-glycero-D-manno-heptose 1,7-bisphosphate phosphatase
MQPRAPFPASLGIRAVPPRSDGRPAVFLDKDGTVVQDIPYNVEPRLMRVAPGAVRGLTALAAQGYALVVISNQPGVALGLHTERDLEKVRNWLVQRFEPLGLAFAGIYMCPHHPQGLVSRYARRCHCRKPRPGMVLRAAAEHGLSLRDSWFVGDILDDVECGRRAGCRTILLNSAHAFAGDAAHGRRGQPGNGKSWLLRIPDYTAPDLGAAADLILAEDRDRQSVLTRQARAGRGAVSRRL